MTAVENVSLVREQSNPAVYLVVGDTKFWIIDEAEFAALGFRWDRVRVVTDGSLRRLREDRLHAPPRTRPSDVYFDGRKNIIGLDGTWYTNSVTAEHRVRTDVLIAGWLHDGQPYHNRAPHGLEDVFYDLTLDAVFLDRMYGTNGLSNALVDASWPGQPWPTQPVVPHPLRMATVAAPPGGQRGVGFSSWFVSGSADGATSIHPELQAWHVRDWPPALTFTSHWQGRGPAPTHWRPLPQDDNAWFPFDPNDPDQVGTPLAGGDYLVMRGTLWQDHGHGPSLWDVGPTAGHGGWSEIHPPDMIVRVAPPGPNLRVTARGIGLITPPGSTDEVAHEATMTPDFSAATPSRYLQTRRAWGEIDPVVTDVATLNRYGVTRHDREVTVDFRVAPWQGRQGRVKGAALAGWAERDVRDEVWIDDALPAGVEVAATGGDTWEWTTDKPGPFTGTLAHRSAAAAGAHQHYFWNAATPVIPASGDRLFTMVWLDPQQPPDEIMVQFCDGSWDHRAFWGVDRIGWGSPGTASRWHAGDLPPSGEWARLEIDAGILGLTGRPIIGMAFTCYDGAALWDCSGVWRAPAWGDVGHANRVVALCGESTAPGELVCVTREPGGRIVLWTRPPTDADIAWTQHVSAATGITALAHHQGVLWNTSTDDGLYTRQLRGPLSFLPATRVGHANGVTALAAANRLLFCVTADDQLWSRPPAFADVNWTPIGTGNGIIALTAHGDTLLGVSVDARLWRRQASRADRVWEHAGAAPANAAALAVADGHLWCATTDNRLWRRPL